MKHLTLFLLTLALSTFALAEFEIPNEFEDGQVTSAAEMNANFQAIKAAINALNTAQPDVVTFQGYSAPIIGTAGVHAFASACEAVSAGSRICTGDELTLSPSSNASTDLDGYAWIARELSQANISAAGEYSQQTYEKKWYDQLQSCLTGDAHVIKHGRYHGFSGISCDDTYPIACCK
jgi:hypothetical protein